MIKFIHPDNLYSLSKEQLVTSIYGSIRQYISLPKQIEVEFKCIGPNVYGETYLLPRKTINRFVLNADLPTKDIFYPCVHEFIHLHQIHSGKLSVSRTGVFVWNGAVYPIDPSKLTYAEYQNLPWEQDAHDMQHDLVKKILDNQ